MHQYNQDAVDKLDDVKSQIDLAIGQIKNGTFFRMTATEYLENSHRYGPESILVGDYVISSRFHQPQSTFMLDALTQAVRDIAVELRRMRDNRDLLSKLEQMEVRIMSAISEFATKQQAFNARMDASIAGLSADVESLAEQIRKLQETAGQITPEDQALLDDIEKRTDAITTKLEALDALMPPTPPTT